MAARSLASGDLMSPRGDTLGYEDFLGSGDCKT